MHCLIVLEARSPNSRCQQDHAFSLLVLKAILGISRLQLYNANLCHHQQIVIFLCVLKLSFLKTPVILD